MTLVIFLTAALTLWIIMLVTKYKKWHNIEINCTIQVAAKVIDVLERRPARGDMTYKPILQIIDDNNTYIIDSAYYSSMRQPKLGEIVQIRINPNNYKEFVYINSNYNHGKTLDIIACCIYPIFIIIILSVFLIKTNK